MSTYRPNPDALTSNEQAVEKALPGWKVVRNIPEEYRTVSPSEYTSEERLVAHQMANAEIVRANPEYHHYLRQVAGSNAGSGARHIDAVGLDIASLQKRHGIVQSRALAHKTTLSNSSEVLVRMQQGQHRVVRRLYVRQGKIESYQG